MSSSPLSLSEKIDSAVKRVDFRCKNFQELEARLGAFPELGSWTSSKSFAEWLDRHGYKTFPDMPDYVE